LYEDKRLDSGQRQITQSVFKVEGDGLEVSGGKGCRAAREDMENWAPFDVVRTNSLLASIQATTSCRRF